MFFAPTFWQLLFCLSYVGVGVFILYTFGRSFGTPFKYNRLYLSKYIYIYITLKVITKSHYTLHIKTQLYLITYKSNYTKSNS